MLQCVSQSVAARVAVFCNNFRIYEYNISVLRRSVACFAYIFVCVLHCVLRCVAVSVAVCVASSVALSVAACFSKRCSVLQVVLHSNVKYCSVLQ